MARQCVDISSRKGLGSHAMECSRLHQAVFICCMFHDYVSFGDSCNSNLPILVE